MSAAIPTLYNGVMYRSRLEARWACFFDLCGWPYQYEPIDLDGWIPDFALGWNHTLVEVKPFFTEQDFAPVVEKIDAAGCTADVVLLGAAPRPHTGEDGPWIGWLSEARTGERSHGLWNLDFGYTEGNGRLGLCPMDGAWVNVIWEAPRGISHPNKWSRVGPLYRDGFSKPPVDHVWPDLWARASNVTQWRGRGSPTTRGRVA